MAHSDEGFSPADRKFRPSCRTFQHMDAIETHTSLRSRVSGRAATEPIQPSPTRSLPLDDPFAGDDEPWAPEDWIGNRAVTPDAEVTSGRFRVGLVFDLGLSGLGLLVAAVAVLHTYQLLT